MYCTRNKQNYGKFSILCIYKVIVLYILNINFK